MCSSAGTGGAVDGILIEMIPDATAGFHGKGGGGEGRGGGIGSADSDITCGVAVTSLGGRLVR